MLRPPSPRRAPPPLASLAPSPASLWPPPKADPAAVWVEGVSAGPLGRAPDALFEGTFRAALARELGRDSTRPGYAGVIELVRELITTFDTPATATAASRRVLNSLFPDWPPFAPRDRVGLLYWFEVLFAKPFPGFSAKLNAWVTWWAAQWLMGPCELADLERADVDAPARLAAGDGTGQLLVVKRCRFLEESACASVCVNACKMPTQAFFNSDMGVPMRLVPDYETLECRFEFGVPPTAGDESEARSTPCLAGCPTMGRFAAATTRQADQEQEAAATERCVTMGESTSDDEEGGRRV